MPAVIKVENLSKAYQLGEIGTGTISRDLERTWARIRGKEDPFLKIGEVNDRSVKGESDIVWSLKDLNFEIEQGDAVGIIGRNGAGKSTLLKILSRVTAPTTGSVKIKGRIASLLEVGTGFHPELTGRENIYLNGAILGMRKAEIKQKFDQIVDFSGVDRYIDTPVKRYSSGMYVRLAFAVAAHLESEILIVDEVLAVGDAEFQKKCLGKMGDVSKGEGRTVLFVSHNMDAVTRLCNTAILLNNGIIETQGFSDRVIHKYLETNMLLKEKIVFEQKNSKYEDVTLLKAFCCDKNGVAMHTFNVTEDIIIKFQYRVNTNNLKFIHGINIHNEKDLNLFDSHDINSGAEAIDKVKGKIYTSKCIIPKNLFNEGTFSVSIAIFQPEPLHIFVHALGVLKFKIIDKMDGTSARGNITGNFPGLVRPLLKWEYEY